jgi:branched-chain amino acid transport system ATP-binding protein
MPPAQIVKRGISLVPEGRRIFGPLTVRENLIMGSYVRRRQGERAAIDRDMERIFQSFPVLHDRAEQLAGSLSGGEQQMLAIGRALMNRPRFLLLDEPSMGLAPLLVKEIFNVLSELKSTKTTILLVEQNARIALQICDRAYVLERGRLALEGTRGELLDNSTIKKAYLGE